MQEIYLEKTLAVVTDCWEQGEVALRRKVDKTAPSADEEFLTRELHALFAEQLGIASADKRIERAFLADLFQAYEWDHVNTAGFANIAAGLIADVTLHHRGTEKVTGGDLGFVLVQPSLHKPYGGVGTLSIDRRRSGLLVQAKLRKASGRWRELTKNQKEILPNHLEYSALLLYSYQDTKRRNLIPLQWQPCADAAGIKDVARWLDAGVFPAPKTSADLIRSLSKAQVGTTDAAIIDGIVSPAGNTWIELSIDWPDGHGPGSHVYVHSQVEAEVKVRQQVRIRTG